MSLSKFFGKLLNISSVEWRRVNLAWLLSFLYRSGFVVGWTVLVALFVGKYGIASLPFLFVLHAVFSILGTTFYSVLIDRYDNRMLMISTLFMAVGFLTLAIIFGSSSIPMFVTFVIVAEAVFLTQFRILLSGFYEEMFTPLESARALPMVESADTIGGILGGVVILGFAENFQMYDFAYLWVALLILIVPILLLSGQVLSDVVFFQVKEVEKRPSLGIVTKIKRELKKAKQYSFLKGLMFAVLLQWLLFNLLEFQYTKAVYNNVSGVILDTGSGLEHMLAHELGLLFVIFSLSSLILQLFLAGRLISSLGVIGTMILHPLVTILSMFSFIFSFNFFTAALVKNNFTMSSVLFNNAYHNSYYAVSEKLRGHTREVLEGVVRPMGALFGTLVLILLQVLFHDSALIFAINLAIVFIALMMMVLFYWQQKHYTQAAVDGLLCSVDLHARSNSVLILAQKGHNGRLSPMLKVLENEQEPNLLRVKVLNALAILRPIDAVSSVLNTFESSSGLIREAAVETLYAYSELKDFSNRHLILGYDLLESLKTLYAAEDNKYIRSKIIQIIARLSSVAALEYLLKLLKNSHGDLKSDVILALAEFKDASIARYVEPYLDSKVASYRVNAAIVLSKFPEFHDLAMHCISSFVYTDSQKNLGLAIFAFGELAMKSRRKFCEQYLGSKSAKLKSAAAIALAKMGASSCVPALSDMFFELDEMRLKELKSTLQNVDVRIRLKLDRMVKHLVSREILKIMEKNRGKNFSTFSLDQLMKLRGLYLIIDEHDEVERIDSVRSNNN